MKLMTAKRNQSRHADETYGLSGQPRTCLSALTAAPGSPPSDHAVLRVLLRGPLLFTRSPASLCTSVITFVFSTLRQSFFKSVRWLSVACGCARTFQPGPSLRAVSTATSVLSVRPSSLCGSTGAGAGSPGLAPGTPAFVGCVRMLQPREDWRRHLRLELCVPLPASTRGACEPRIVSAHVPGTRSPGAPGWRASGLLSSEEGVLHLPWQVVDRARP